MSVFLYSQAVIALESQTQTSNDCQDVLNWIVKDLTVKNLDKSVERMNKKMALAFFYANNSSEELYSSMAQNPELLSIFESMQRVDADFENYLANNQPYKRYKKWSWLPWVAVATDNLSYKDLIGRWKNLQSNQPTLFNDMPPEYKLDEWDLATADILDKVSASNIANPESKEKFQNLARTYDRRYQDLINGNNNSSNSQIRSLKNQIDSVHSEMDELIKDIFLHNIDKFERVCPEDEFYSLLSNDSLVCPLNENESYNLTESLSLKLRDLTNIVNPEYINNIQEPSIPDVAPEDEYTDLQIEPYEYDNINYEGSYCERDLNLVDTAVIHHTATSNQFTPQDVHNTQVAAHENDRDSSGNPDPWYMIAYNYAITADYNGTNSTVYQGRPTTLKGAHAGGYVNLDQLDPSVRTLAENYSFKCGYNTDHDANHVIDRRDYKTERKYARELREGYISANMTTVGVSVIGNYMPDMIRRRSGGYEANPSGYPRNQGTRYPTDASLKKVGELICKLKKETHPHLRKITDHNFIKIKKQIADGTATAGTCCPGTVYYRMQKIRDFAMEACNFSNNEFVLDISPSVRLCYGLRNL